MAALTGGFLVKLLVQVWLMDIIMTIHTRAANFPETPIFILFMTGKTGCCQVCTRQLKSGLIMPFSCESGSFKAKGGMTIGTIG